MLHAIQAEGVLLWISNPFSYYYISLVVFIPLFFPNGNYPLHSPFVSNQVVTFAFPSNLDFIQITSVTSSQVNTIDNEIWTLSTTIWEGNGEAVPLSEFEHMQSSHTQQTTIQHLNFSRDLKSAQHTNT